MGSLHAEEPLLIKGPLLYRKGLLFCLSHRFVKKSIINFCNIFKKSTILYKRTTQLKFLATGLGAMINVIILLCTMYIVVCYDQDADIDNDQNIQESHSDQELRWQLLQDIYKNTAFIKGMFGKQIFE